ncbi:MAG TPA: RHS repeat domain-containing protein [Candidatus Acidoferrum sp.]
MNVKQTELVILVVSLLALPLPMAQVKPPEENKAIMSDREQRGLRGPVKSCTEESTHPGMTDADGKTYPEVHSEYTTEYDADGRILATRSRNSDGSQWVTMYTYDASGRLLKVTSGVEGKAVTRTTYSYDQQGRLQNISDDAKHDSPVVFHYDERGRKTKIEISRSADYRPNTAVAGSPFEVADRAPNLPGGGSTTTIYDEHDRATEVQVRDANGELVNRALRMYDAQGHIIEEKQILDNPETMIPSEARAKMLDESGLSADQLQRELRGQLTKLMAGQSGPYSVSYHYDTHGRVNHTTRRIFNHEEEIATIYNEHGDMESEITRSTRVTTEADPSTPAPSLPSYSEVHYSYQYDQRENWTEKAVLYRTSPAGTFQSSTVIKRALAYY